MSTHTHARSRECEPPESEGELGAWRELGTAMNALLCQILAAQGDHAERELVAMQHRIAELLEKPKI